MGILFRIIVLAVCLASFGGCGETESPPSPGISLEDGWVRSMPLMTEGEGAGTNSAAYLVIRNGGESTDRLTGAVTPVAEAVEVHESRVVNDVMTMREVGVLEIPPGDSVVLKPGGLHLMLLGLRAPLLEGEELDLTLNFEVAGERHLRIPVRSMGGR